MFGIRAKKSELHSLTEQEIRHRLYGTGAVGTIFDTITETQQPKKPTALKDKTGVKDRRYAQTSQTSPEQANLYRELQSLKKELTETKRRLHQQRQPTQVSKTKLLPIIVTTVIVSTLVSIFIINFFLIKRLRSSAQDTAEPQRAAISRGYSVQVATYDTLIDAEGFSTDLASKGYKAFTRESIKRTHKKRYNVYVGLYQDRQAAQKALRRVKTDEGLRDSFITHLSR